MSTGDAFCLCGAQAGYLHDPDCPWPCFKNSAEGEHAWEGDFLGAKFNRSQIAVVAALQQVAVAADADAYRAKCLLRKQVAEYVELADSLRDLRRQMLAAAQESQEPAVKP